MGVESGPKIADITSNISKELKSKENTKISKEEQYKKDVTAYLDIKEKLQNYREEDLLEHIPQNLVEQGYQQKDIQNLINNKNQIEKRIKEYEEKTNKKIESQIDLSPAANGSNPEITTKTMQKPEEASKSAEESIKEESKNQEKLELTNTETEIKSNEIIKNLELSIKTGKDYLNSILILPRINQNQETIDSVKKSISDQEKQLTEEKAKLLINPEIKKLEDDIEAFKKMANEQGRSDEDKKRIEDVIKDLEAKLKETEKSPEDIKKEAVEKTAEIATKNNVYEKTSEEKIKNLSAEVETILSDSNSNKKERIAQLINKTRANTEKEALDKIYGTDNIGKFAKFWNKSKWAAAIKIGIGGMLGLGSLAVLGSPAAWASPFLYGAGAYFAGEGIIQLTGADKLVANSIIKMQEKRIGGKEMMNIINSQDVNDKLNQLFIEKLNNKEYNKENRSKIIQEFLKTQMLTEELSTKNLERYKKIEDIAKRIRQYGAIGGVIGAGIVGMPMVIGGVGHFVSNPLFNANYLTGLAGAWHTVGPYSAAMASKIGINFGMLAGGAGLMSIWSNIIGAGKKIDFNINPKQQEEIKKTAEEFNKSVPVSGETEKKETEEIVNEKSKEEEKTTENKEEEKTDFNQLIKELDDIKADNKEVKDKLLEIFNKQKIGSVEQKIVALKMFTTLPEAFTFDAKEISKDAQKDAIKLAAEDLLNDKNVKDENKQIIRNMLQEIDKPIPQKEIINEKYDFKLNQELGFKNRYNNNKIEKAKITNIEDNNGNKIFELSFNDGKKSNFSIKNNQLVELTSEANKGKERTFNLSNLNK